MNRFPKLSVVGAAALLVLLAAAPLSATDAPRLRSALRDASVVVSGEVVQVTPYADGRLVVAEFAVAKVLKGRLADSEAKRLTIVESRELPTPPIFVAGERGVAWLRPAQRTTFLVQTLPPGAYLQPTGRDPGFLAAASPDELTEIESVLDRLLASSRKPEQDAALRDASRRQLAFTLVGARNPVLVDDGVTSLRALPALASTLNDQERRQIETALRRTDLPVRTRVALIDAVGATGLVSLVPVLQQLDTPPEVLAASWKALDALHSPPPVDSLEERLASSDPRVRHAAAREILRREGTAAIGRVAPLATQDPDRTVRLAAIAALGELKSPDALPLLERVFAYEEGEMQQAAARAIVAIGGDPAAEALGRLAFQAPPGAQRYALMLLLVEFGQDDPRVQRVATAHPDESMRDAVEHGFDVHKH